MKRTDVITDAIKLALMTSVEFCILTRVIQHYEAARLVIGNNAGSLASSLRSAT